MGLLTLFGYSVEINAAATKAWYASAEQWGCECGHCRNFLKLASGRALPSAVLDILEQLGIPPEKATYVCSVYPSDTGYCYQFSYRIAGQILSEPHTDITDFARCCHETYPYGAPDFPSPHFDLEFWLTLPWELQE